MNNPKKVIVNGDEVIERAFNADELEQLEKDRAEAEAAYAEIAPALEAAKAQRQAILDKLGITQEEARLLLG
jgi:multidrug efflux pump subunit AcrA (membrane-fusion protein)